jgi:hypothetical protein
MSQQIIVDDKVYDVLNEMKKRVSRRASFNTIVSELIRKSAGSLQADKKFIREIRETRQKKAIWFFIRELQDADLVSERISEYDIMPVMYLLINNKWIELAGIVNQKAQFVQNALDQYNENLELVARNQLKKVDPKPSSGDTRNGVLNAIDGIFMNQKLGYATKNISTKGKSTKKTSSSTKKKSS